ncbi:hypothetical protein [Rhizobium leguminosarum]|uniref:hypothetical protein n=1 Tax=Rhizobium leguminosarum TaxID=384 RepID=UPI001C9523C2|nr:hypothetical protein [Rhizobium leguminosarum]MBY5436497.1 hypothetical protein [Rhizobium leguminosarum]
MGEAKSGREKLRAAIMAELERLMAPTSPEEDALNDEIRALKFYEFNRVPDKQLAYMKMEAQRCHQNAAAYAKLDPSGESRQISGWWKRNGIFYFHSVILSQTKLHCITPHKDSAPLKFAPDFEIVWVETDGVVNADRRGAKLPYLVRDFPDKVIAEATEARDALLKGADPRSIKIGF